MRRVFLIAILAAGSTSAAAPRSAHVFGVGEGRLMVSNPARFYDYRDRLKQRYEFSRQLKFQRYWRPEASHCSMQRSELYRMAYPPLNERGYDGYPAERTLRMTPMLLNDGGHPE